MTRSELVAKVKMAVNFSTVATQLCEELYKALIDAKNERVRDEDLGRIVDNISNCRWKVNEAMTALDHFTYLTIEDDLKVEDDDDINAVSVPEVKVIGNAYVEISVPVNGGKLIAGVCDIDEAGQAYINYQYERSIIDLALAEVKSGELAETAGLPTDNKDIDLYLYSDANSEEYQEHVRMKYQDITGVFVDDESGII
jgi:hypothetical protein